MKFSYRWLSKMLSSEVELEHMLERLTLAGLEVDGCEPLPAIDGIVVAHIDAIEQHPDADKLRVCTVNDGIEQLQIVCGAPNARAGIFVALASIGSKLPGGIKIRKSKLRGVESHGMLCSGAELGFSDDHDGIIELPAGYALGTAIADVYDLPDHIVDVDLTPNRGDCFSLTGVAREVATFGGFAFTEPTTEAVPATIDDDFRATVQAKEAVPVFGARVIRGINAQAATPLWMKERLRRSGIRSIHPVVDITNYVMLEYGQPLHGYDLDKLQGNIGVRQSKAGEKLTLLDEREITLDDDSLVITDDSGAIGLGGIMGGLSTAVDDNTTNIVFEAAFFSRKALAGRARRYGLHTDASLRFERGVDPTQQARAIERATALLLEIAGGDAAQLLVETSAADVPARNPVTLRVARLQKVLGLKIDASEVTAIFERLGMQVTSDTEQWQVTAPGFRFDIEIEEDLIEEVARVYGYDRLPEIKAYAQTALAPATEYRVREELLRDHLVAKGYFEAITYSFIDPADDAGLGLAKGGPVLVNPISSELSAMRGSLLPGLLKATAHNLARQRSRVRFFELGTVFAQDDDPAQAERQRLSGIAAGALLPEQWSSKAASVDFFDIKSDVMSLLSLTGRVNDIEFVATQVAGLHPGQAAEIHIAGERVGVIGAVHPAVAKAYDIEIGCFAFDLDISTCFAAKLPVSSPISRFPKVRRDIAVLVAEDKPIGELIKTCEKAGGKILNSVTLFDIYQGKGVEPGIKSVALGLILLESSRTLTDSEADDAIAQIVSALGLEHGAKLRE